MLRELVAAGAGDLLQRLLEAGVVEHLDAPALVAHEVVVVLAARKRGLEAGHAAAEIHAVHETELRQPLEDAVHARDPHLLALRAQAVEELLGRDAAVLALELGDDRLAGAARPRAGAAELRADVLAPGRCARHNEIIVILNTVCGIQTSLVRERIVLILALGAAVLVAFAAGCGGGESDAASGTEVVAAFYPLAFLAERIDPAANVTSVTPAGAEPHDVELSARDIERVRDAHVVLYLGRGFQPALEDAVAGQDGAVDVLQGMALIGGEADADPHVWLDPMRFAAMARRVAAALGRPAAADPLVADLEKLDREFRTGLAHCERRELVTSHAAFGYLARAYGLKEVPLTGVVPEAEPSARDIEALVREVEQGGATTVFSETLVSPKLAETVAREAGAETAVLDPLEGLTEDEVSAGEDYFSVMRANLAALRKALGCT